MIKALVIIRTSTTQQEVESQAAETIEYAKSYGYSDEEILVIGEAGASAIKLDDAYLINLNKIYTAIEEHHIECVFAWQLDRIGRDEVVLISLKTKLIKKKIQLRIKNPTLFLFDENGTVNSGMDIAINMFIAMSRQEMETKKARFKRAKKRNSEEMKFNGGKNVKYGYKVDDNNYVVKNDNEAAVVVELYKLYSTGKYSIKSLTELLNARGYEFSRKQVTDILSNTCYKGYTNYSNNMRSHRKYQPIVSDELWDEVEKVRLQNKWDCPKTKNDWLGIKIVKCPVCGHNCVANRDVYQCVYYFTKSGKCNCSVSFSQFNMDRLLLYIALPEHKIYSSTDKTARIAKLKNDLKDTQCLIELKNKEKEETNKQRERTNKLYIKGKINDSQLEMYNQEIDKNVNKIDMEVSQLAKEIINIEHTIEQLQAGNKKKNMFGKLTLKELSNITHTYCKRAIFYRKDANSKLCIIVEVEYLAFCYDEFEVRKRVFEYYPYSKLYKFFENGECIDDSMSRILGDLSDVIINTKKGRN